LSTFYWTSGAGQHETFSPGALCCGAQSEFGLRFGFLRKSPTPLSTNPRPAGLAHPYLSGLSSL
jgi:hypothetical protein